MGGVRFDPIMPWPVLLCAALVVLGVMSWSLARGLRSRGRAWLLCRAPDGWSLEAGYD